jgi:hypothetical protein
MVAYLVEIDVHALELEVRRAVVPVMHQLADFLCNVSLAVNIHARAVEAMLAGDGLPEGSTDLVALCGCQLHALHLAFIGCGSLDVHTGQSGGEPIREKLVSNVVFSAKQ